METAVVMGIMGLHEDTENYVCPVDIRMGHRLYPCSWIIAFGTKRRGITGYRRVYSHPAWRAGRSVPRDALPNFAAGRDLHELLSRTEGGKGAPACDGVGCIAFTSRGLNRKAMIRWGFNDEEGHPPLPAPAWWARYPDRSLLSVSRRTQGLPERHSRHAGNFLSMTGQGAMHIRYVLLGKGR